MHVKSNHTEVWNIFLSQIFVKKIWSLPLHFYYYSLINVTEYLPVDNFVFMQEL